MNRQRFNSFEEYLRALIASKEILIQYIRVENGEGSKGKPIGAMVALKNFSKLSPAWRFGWSLTNIQSGDSFDKHTGLKIAIKRAHGKPDLVEKCTTPKRVNEQWVNFCVRASKYFGAAE